MYYLLKDIYTLIRFKIYIFFSIGRSGLVDLVCVLWVYSSKIVPICIRWFQMKTERNTTIHNNYLKKKKS